MPRSDILAMPQHVMPLRNLFARQVLKVGQKLNAAWSRSNEQKIENCVNKGRERKGPDLRNGLFQLRE